MDIIKDQQITLSSAEISNMKPCSLGVSPATSSVFNSPSYSYTQSYGVPFKLGNQWIPYNTSLSKLFSRLETFKTWCSEIKLQPWNFTKSGFYYSGDADAVTCFFCGTTITNWVRAEDINTEHKKHSPSCHFLKIIYDDFNTTLLTSDIVLDICPHSSKVIPHISSPCSFGISLTETGWIPYNTSMVKLRNRLNSFKHWPIQMKQRPDDLAKLGFYYIEIGYTLACFHYGIRVLKWESTDLPDIEHKKHSPYCKYLYITQSI